MRQALALFFSLFFIVAPFFTKVPQAYADTMCCDPGWTLANGAPAALTECGAGTQAFDTNTCCNRHYQLLGHEVMPSHFCDPGQVTTTPTCSWSALDNDQSPYNGKPAFCAGNFAGATDLRAHNLSVGCDGAFCGSLIKRLFNGTGNTEVVSLSDTTNANIGNNKGRDFTCITGDLDSGVLAVYKSNIERAIPGCGITVAAGIAVTGLTTGGWAIPVGLAATGATLEACKTALTTASVPNIVGHVLGPDGKTIQCTATMPVEFIVGEPSSTTTNHFDLCKQIPDPTQQAACRSCNTSYGGTVDTPKAIWTSVGCIPTSSNAIVAALVKLGLGIAGTVALLMILAGAFMLSTSQGDTKRVSEARELITSAIIGLVFIIFSVSLLQFIGVNIFQIPGFGKPL